MSDGIVFLLILILCVVLGDKEPRYRRQMIYEQDAGWSKEKPPKWMWPLMPVFWAAGLVLPVALAWTFFFAAAWLLRGILQAAGLR